MANRIAQLQSMLLAEPDDTFCLYGLAMEYAKSGQFGKAIEFFDHTLAIDPNYSYAYFHKAKALEETGDIETARSTLHTGLTHARQCGDGKAANEIAAFLDELA